MSGSIYKDVISEFLRVSPLSQEQLAKINAEVQSLINEPTSNCGGPTWTKETFPEHPFVGGKIQKDKVENGSHNLQNSASCVGPNGDIIRMPINEYKLQSEYVGIGTNEAYIRRGLDPNIRFLPTPLKQMDERHKNTLKGKKRTLAQKLASKKHSEKWHTFGKSPTPKGGKLSEEHKQSLRKPKSKFTKPYHKCPHCGLEGHSNSMKRWHFDNCKQKVTNLV